jgi:flagellar hook-associated protein 1 FlgK
MSIASALSNALSGLGAATRATELISNNVANALTPGYSRRTLELSAAQVNGAGAGVAIAGVRVAQDPVTTSERRATDAELGYEQALFDAMDRIALAIGEPGDARALPERAAALENSLLAAANDPASVSRQANVVNAAVELADRINAITLEYRQIRMDSDAEIARQVATVNSALTDIADLNEQIQVRLAARGDASGLIDKRSQLVDSIASIIPVRTATREGGQLAVFSRGGAILLDGGTPAELGFSPSGIITQSMALGAGLSGLTVNGRAMAIGTGSDSALLDGGSLSALFSIRDTVVPEAYNRIDAFAADLAGRFQDPAVDPTLAVGDAGLFTDSGLAFISANQSGLASRIVVNAAVDPDQGGAEWRIRDGINATAQGANSDASILAALLDRTRELRVAPAGFGNATAGSPADLASLLAGTSATEAERASQRVARANGYRQGLVEAESATMGVDTDVEMQELLLAEQAYSANARVITVVDSMIRRLLEI